MEQSQPSFVPEWYKGISGGATSNSNFNHYNGSSHPETDEHIRGFSSKNRFSVSACDRDALRSLSFTDKTSSSFRRSASSNGSMGREKDLPFRAYSSFGRSQRDREMDSEKELDFHDRDRPLLLDNGFSSHPDSLIANKSEKDSLRPSHSMVSGRLVSGRRVDPWLRRPGHDLSNGVPSVASIVTGISKTSFEKDFPSLGAEEKHSGSDVPRVSSPGLSTAIHNLPVTASAIIGGDGWTSALAEVPSVVGGNSPMVLSALPTSPTLASASSTSTGLNMAETLAQAPARVRTSPQLPSDSQKIEELHRQQILKLRPVTPSMPKTLCLNSADKSKTKGLRTEFSTSKVGQQPSSQLVIHALRPAAVRSDVSKTSQPGNFQVLNREMNGLSPTGNKDSPNPTNISRVSTVPSGIPAAIPPPKTSVILKVKVDGRGGALNPTLFGEKKPPSQSRNRNDFFNSLRKKTYASQHSNANDDLSCDASSSNLDMVSEQFAVDSDSAKDVKGMSSSNANLQHLMENGDYFTRACDVYEEPEKLAPDEEEAAFLRSLGWEENAGEEALTREEIESFLSEYNKRMPASKLKI